MLTIKHVVRGCDQEDIYEAEHVKYMHGGEGKASVFLWDTKKSFRDGGPDGVIVRDEEQSEVDTVYVVNDHGTTIATYHI